MICLLLPRPTRVMNVGAGSVASISHMRIGLPCCSVMRPSGLVVERWPIIVVGAIWPFPSAAIRAHAERAKGILAVELSTGQMVEDVKLAVEGRCPVHFYGRSGGMVPGGREILEQYRAILAGGQH
jgi:2-oxoglutarate ferredoxin oxidoreductase subunit alpha